MKKSRVEESGGSTMSSKRNLSYWIPEGSWSSFLSEFYLQEWNRFNFSKKILTYRNQQF